MRDAIVFRVDTTENQIGWTLVRESFQTVNKIDNTYRP